MLSDAFVAGVRQLRSFDPHLDFNVNYTQMDSALEFLGRAPDVAIILDHCGKLGIKDGYLDLFRRHMKAVAAYPNVSANLQICRSGQIG